MTNPTNQMTNYGYRYDLERLEAILASAVAMPTLSYAAPEFIDPRPWHRIENQGSMGSCQGHALSSVTEFAYHIATGEVIQFSPMWGYIMTQKKDGLLGRDVGSTIDGGRRVAQEDGMCPLEVFPYPNPVRYSTQIPSGAAEAAAKYKIRTHVVCRSYDDVFNFIAAGLGGVEIGISWNGSMTPVNGVVESYRGGGGSGHAVCFLGYSRRKDNRGRNYLWLPNSWGTDHWGLQGWAEVSPNAVDSMFRTQYTVMIGMSDMIDLKPRVIDWAEDSVFF